MHMQNFSYTVVGSGGGKNGRAMAFYLSRPGSKPMTGKDFLQFRIAVNFFFRWAFSKNV